VIDPADRGFTLGDGLFETLLWREGALRDLPAHLARLSEGCRSLGLPPPNPEAAEAAMRKAVEAAGLEGARAAVRLTLTAGSGGRGLDRPSQLSPSMVASAAPAPPADGPARLQTSRIRRNEHSPVSRLKTLAYLDNVLARAEARAAGADEALMLNGAGEVACAAAANLFWIDAAGRLCTPALGCGVLAGVVRAKVLAAAPSLGFEPLEVREPRSALDAARAMFVTNSLIGVRPVGALDGVAVALDPRMEHLAALVAR
jgi:branched-chain amino acid aminotransferase/4-amino-4-deoxychorismate lyase